MPAPVLISVLARSMLAGAPAPDRVRARAERTLGRSWRWLPSLARRFAEEFGRGSPPRHRDVVRFLLNDSGFARARRRYGEEISVTEWIAEPGRMHRPEFAAGWNLPVMDSVGALAAWLCLTGGELDWFADLKDLGGRLGNHKLQHYHYRVLPKRSGGLRLLEIPKPWIKLLQRRVLWGILDRIPAHPAVHGFVKGRSVSTFVAPHAAKRVLLRMDCEDFFPTFPGVRVQAAFRTFGYPEPVADRLGGICANSVPRAAWGDRPPELDIGRWHDLRALYARPHLPQGAPTSPALANLMAYRLDCRLMGLAKSAGADYTRYADDLAFSGNDEFARVVPRFSAHAAEIALEEGFAIQHRKTRILRQGVRQHLAGIVVNHSASLPRRDLEILEATLTNCVRAGPGSQNRRQVPDFRAHLEGRVGFVEMIHPEKGRRLRVLLDRIQWG